MGLKRTILVLLLLTVAGCSPADLLNATVSAAGSTETTEVAYMPGPRGTLDIYKPNHAGGPLVIFLYGGSWNAGDKSTYAFVARPLAARGAVVVIPNYRLYPEVQFPAFLDDNARAVAWSIAHAAELGADPRSIFVVGHSAGAYNALMLATDPAYLARAGTSRDRLAGVVGLAGPYDFLPSNDPDVIPVFGPANTPANQPIAFADAHAPPLLLLAGTDDTIVMPRNTTSLAQHVQAAGGPVESRLYPGIGHIGLITAFAPIFAARAPVLDDVWSFILRHRPISPMSKAIAG